MTQRNVETCGNQPHQTTQQHAEKRAYARPQLAKHGNVESLSQTQPDPSCPIAHG